MNSQGRFLLRLTGLISLLSKGLSRVFSNTTVWNYQFFGTQPSLWSSSHIIHGYWKNYTFGYRDLCWQSNVSAFQYTAYIFHSFPSKEQASFNFLAAVTVHSDFGAQENKSVAIPLVSLSICHEVMGLDAIIFIFWMLSFKPAFSLSSFTFIKRLFSSLCFLPLGWCHLHIWDYWYFSWFQLVLHPELQVANFQNFKRAQRREE